jgi:cobalt-zinc-cadmium efflux system outer membrane protein
MEQAQLEYNAMQIGLYELLAAKQAQVDATRGYIQTVRDYWVARAELERALGGRVPAAPVPSGSAASAPAPAAMPPTSPGAATHVHGGQ